MSDVKVGINFSATGNALKYLESLSGAQQKFSKTTIDENGKVVKSHKDSAAQISAINKGYLRDFQSVEGARLKYANKTSQELKATQLKIQSEILTESQNAEKSLTASAQNRAKTVLADLKSELAQLRLITQETQAQEKSTVAKPMRMPIGAAKASAQKISAETAKKYAALEASYYLKSDEEIEADVVRLKENKLKALAAIRAAVEQNASAETKAVLKSQSGGINTQLQAATVEKRKREGAPMASMGVNKFKQVGGTMLQNAANVLPMPGMLGSVPGMLAGFGPEGAAVGGALAIGGGSIFESIKKGSEFETSLQHFSALSGITGEQLTKVGTKAEEFARKFGVDAPDAVDAFRLTINALGTDLAKNQPALESMTNDIMVMSKASGSDAATAAAALADTFNEFGGSIANPAQAAKQFTEILNAMAAGAREGNAELPDLIESMKVIGPVAHEEGISIERATAVLETLAHVNIKGSEAGMQLKNILLGLSGAGKAGAKGLEELGLTTADVDVKTVGLQAAMEKVQEKIKGLSQPDKMRVLRELFGREAIAGGSALLANTEKMATFTQRVTGTNRGEEMAATRMDSFAEEMKRAGEIIKTAFIDMYEENKGTFKELPKDFANIAVVATKLIGIVSDSIIEINALLHPGSTIEKIGNRFSHFVAIPMQATDSDLIIYNSQNQGLYPSELNPSEQNKKFQQAAAKFPALKTKYGADVLLRLKNMEAFKALLMKGGTKDEMTSWWQGYSNNRDGIEQEAQSFERGGYVNPPGYYGGGGVGDISSFATSFLGSNFISNIGQDDPDSPGQKKSLFSGSDLAKLLSGDDAITKGVSPAIAKSFALQALPDIIGAITNKPPAQQYNWDGSKKKMPAHSEALGLLGKIAPLAANLLIPGSGAIVGPLMNMLGVNADMKKNMPGLDTLAAGGLSAFFGLESGGYTGRGGRKQPAGIVHAGEFVFSADAVNTIGLGNLDRWHKIARGYESGGYVAQYYPHKTSSSGVSMGGGGFSDAHVDKIVRAIKSQKLNLTTGDAQTMNLVGEQQINLISG